MILNDENTIKLINELAAEVADLKRQLRQALAQVEIVDRALGDPGNTSSKVALAAYVQEKVASELRDLSIKLDRELKRRGVGGLVRGPIRDFIAGAANRAKVTPADQPKEKPCPFWDTDCHHSVTWFGKHVPKCPKA